MTSSVPSWSRPWPSWGSTAPTRVPTQLTDDLLHQADVVVALKSGLGISVPTGVDQQTWDLPNPATWDVDSIRPLRDHIQQRVRALIAEMIAGHDDGTLATGQPPPGQRPTGEASNVDNAFNVSGTSRK